MKKFLTCIITLCFIMTIAGLSLAQTPTYTWKFAHEELEGGWMDLVTKEFAKRLAEKSDGKIKIDIFPIGTLGTSEDMIELLQKNVIQFNWSDIGHIGSQIAEAQVFLLHYIFPKDLEVVKQVLMKGKFNEALASLYRQKNLEPLAYFSEGWQIWSSNKPLLDPSDFKNFKIRTMTSKLIIDNYKAYGANPTPIPYPELYSSLQLGVVEGQENPFFLIYDTKFHEVQNVFTNAYCSPFILTLTTNKDFFSSLPKDIQNIIKETAIELIPYGFEIEEKINSEKLEKIRLEKPTVTYNELTQEQINKFAKSAASVREKFFEMAPEHGSEILKILETDIKEAQKK